MGEWLRCLTGTIGGLVERLAVTASEDEPLFALVARMRASGQAAALIIDADDRVGGFVTAEDLVERAMFTLEPDQPVSAALRGRVPVLAADDRVYQALAEMRRQRRSVLPVVDATGRPLGVVRMETILAAPLAGLLAPLDAAVMRDATPSPDVKAAQAGLVAALLAAGDPAMEVIGLINALNRDIMLGVLREALATMAAAGWGEPPVAFAVLVMGSAGRGESLLNPDQDNGFILGEYPESEQNRIEPFFLELAQRFTRGLAQAGFPLCTGDVMATNPLWRKTLPQWQAQVTDWMRSRGNQALMFTDIFYDFREIAGPPELAAALRRHVTEAARDNLPFLAQMSWQQKEQASSVDLFGQLIAKDGPEQDAIDLKLRATKPLTEIVRLLALKSGVAATSNQARLAGLMEAGVLVREDAARLNDDLVFLLDILLRHQSGRMSAGRAPDNYVKPDLLLRTEREWLVHVCRDIDRWRQRLAAEYIPVLG